MYKTPYLHDEHAGALEDIIVHSLLAEALVVLRHKSVTYVDTHAAAGSYKFGFLPAARRRTLAHTSLPLYRAVRGRLVRSALRHLWRRANQYSKVMRVFPGSPALARALLRNERAHLVLNEKNPRVFERLAKWAEPQSNVSVTNSDGFLVARDLLLDAEKRKDTFFYIDPAYEGTKAQLSDYERVADVLRLAPIGATTLAITYPAAHESDVARFNRMIEALPAARVSGVSASLAFQSRGSRP